jgi:hypothetical protein
VTYCMANTATEVELMNAEGLRSWLEETLREHRRLFLPGLWGLADWAVHGDDAMSIDAEPSVGVRRKGLIRCSLDDITTATSTPKYRWHAGTAATKVSPLLYTTSQTTAPRSAQLVDISVGK